MTYSVNSGVYEQNTATFPAFKQALLAYRIKRAYQLTLGKGAWFSVSLRNEERVDLEDPTGLTEDEMCLVFDDTVPRSLLSGKPEAFHDLVCKHVITTPKLGTDGLLRRMCSVCGHAYLEISF